MPRPKRNGRKAADPNKHKLNDIFVRKLQPRPTSFRVWDTLQRGLVLVVQPTGHKSWKCVYAFHRRPRWYSIGNADAIGLAQARKLAGRVMFAVAEGKDPAAERRADRSRGTFEELAVQYVEQHAKKKNKSWKQADTLVRRHLLPKLGNLQAADISRPDMRTVMGRIMAPIVANQTLAAASAIFSWAIRNEAGGVSINPCHGVDRNETRSRERVLADSELKLFWEAFDDAGTIRSTALKVILLTGQRPGEVAHMRREHLVDGWWEMPGKPVPSLRWPGTKNGADHRVWLPPKVVQLIDEIDDTNGPVFPGASKLDEAMREICAKLQVERTTPHDLRRTHGTKIARMGFGRDAMNRIENHKDGGIATVYDRHQYADENKRIMEAVASEILSLIEGRPTADNVTPLRRGTV